MERGYRPSRGRGYWGGGAGFGGRSGGGGFEGGSGSGGFEGDRMEFSSSLDLVPGRYRFHDFLQSRVRVIMSDKRWIEGKLLAFDRHLNLIVEDAVHHHLLRPKTKNKAEIVQKKVLGFVMIKGPNVVTISTLDPPNDEMMASVCESFKDHTLGKEDEEDSKEKRSN